MASTGLLAPATLGLCVRRRVNPRSAHLMSCHTRGTPTSANFESNSQSVLWCGRQTAEHPDPCVSACYLRTRGHQQQGEDAWIVTPVASEHGCGQRTSMLGTHNPSWGGWAVYIAGLRSWQRDHSSCSGGDPSYPLFEQCSSWPDRCDRTRWVVHLGSPSHNQLCRLIGLVPEKCYWSGVDEAPSSTRKYYRGALRYNNRDPSFTQPPLNVVEV